jgi:hypothetical protein
LYAWIGLDEFGSGQVGLKRAIVPAGDIPLVAIDRTKVDRAFIREQLQAQADRYGVTIHLAEFTLAEDGLVVLAPRGGKTT